jgi:hypothetical protein
MKVLIIESIANKPHLETSGEIALNYKIKNHKVFFAWIGNGLPWNDWENPYILKLFNIKIENRVNLFKEILKKNRIDVLNDKIINNKELIKYEKISKQLIRKNKNLNNLKYKNIDLGIGIKSSLISYLKDSKINFSKNYKKIIKLIISSIIIVERTLSLILKVKPKLIITFNNRFFLSNPIIQIAKKYNIKIIRHERGSSYKKYELYKKDVHDIHYIKKQIKKYWNNKNVSITKKITLSKKYFWKRRNQKLIGKDGGISFTSNQKINKIYCDIDYSKKIFVYFTSTEYEWTSHVGEFNQINAFEKFLSVVNTIDNAQLIIRVHPSATKYNENYNEDIIWEKYKSNKVKIISSKNQTDSYALIKIADFVIGFSSNIIIESAYMKKPSISLSNNTYYSDCRSIYYPKNKVTLKKILNFKTKKKINQIDLYKVAYYFETFGKKFKFYKPNNYHDGFFLGKKIEWKNNLIKILEFFGFKLFYFYLLNLFKKI